MASGAAETVPYVAVTNLARTLDAAEGARASGSSGADERRRRTISSPRDLDGPIAWVLGAEGEGMRRLTREPCDRLVRIPMLGQVESLNVSVAAGICLYESPAPARPGGTAKSLISLRESAPRSAILARFLASPVPHTGRLIAGIPRIDGNPLNP